MLEFLIQLAIGLFFKAAPPARPPTQWKPYTPPGRRADSPRPRTPPRRIPKVDEPSPAAKTAEWRKLDPLGYQASVLLPEEVREEAIRLMTQLGLGEVKKRAVRYDIFVDVLMNCVFGLGKWGNDSVKAATEEVGLTAKSYQADADAALLSVQRTLRLVEQMAFALPQHQPRVREELPLGRVRVREIPPARFPRQMGQGRL